MSKLAIAEIGMDRFAWDPNTGTLVTEASQLGPVGMGTWWLRRMYDDACDEGIAIRSHHTGRVQRFYLHDVVRRDNELVFWEFAPEDKNSRVKSVVIFND